MSNEVLLGLAAEARKNRFSTLPKLTDEDVISVWDGVAYFIERNMASQKGVSLSGLGVFTFTQKKLDVGNKRSILIQRPVFVVSEKFTMIHGLERTKYHTNGQIPVVQLNFSVLAKEVNMDRELVEGCVKEILMSLSRHIQAKRAVEFTFSKIGKLLIRDLRVKMKFFKDFLKSMDGSDHLLKAMANRPGTADSVISRMGTPISRPGTSFSLILPRITPGDLSEERPESNDNMLRNSKQRMPAISEEETNSACEDDGYNPSTPDSGLQQPISPTRLRTAPPSFTRDIDRPPSTSTGKRPKHQSAPATADRRASSRAPRGIKGLSIHPGSRLNDARDAGEVENEEDGRGSVSSTLPSTDDTSPIRSESLPRPRNPSMRQSARKTTDHFSPVPMTADVLSSVRAAPIKTKLVTPPRTASARVKSFDPTCSGCVHSAGQELCYLCHQRDRRNVPMYFAAERMRKEQEEDRLLQQYQNVQDSAAILGEQAKKLANRHENQKIAAFNLGISEAIKNKNSERPTDFHRSYVFQKRPITPPHYIQQEKYAGSLALQVQEKSDRLNKAVMETDFLERLEQVQLAEDLATQRKHYMRNKKLQNEEYRKALDTQFTHGLKHLCKGPLIIYDPGWYQREAGLVSQILATPKIYIRKCLESQNSSVRGAGLSSKAFSLPKPNIILPFQHAQVMRVKEPGNKMTHFKPLPIPAAEPDSEGPIFGVHDDTNEKSMKTRQRAFGLYQDQLNMVADKKKKAIWQDIQMQKEESEMLQRTRQELLEDMLDRHSMQLNQRRDLEQNWTSAVKRKREREDEEKRRAQSPGVLIHEQCDKYRRCRQCKRQMANCGESNVWSESRYVPGSMLMA